jgi:hypothetical protein
MGIMVILPPSRRSISGKFETSSDLGESQREIGPASAVQLKRKSTKKSDERNIARIRNRNNDLDFETSEEEYQDNQEI